MTDEEKKELALNTPPPKFSSIFDEPHPKLTEEYIKKIELETEDSEKYIEAVKSATWENRKLTFITPFQHMFGDMPMGEAIPFLYSPHQTKEDYLAHLSKVVADRRKFIEESKKKIGL